MEGSGWRRGNVGAEKAVASQRIGGSALRVAVFVARREAPTFLAVLERVKNRQG